MEVNGAANIIMLLSDSTGKDISPQLKAKLIRQARILVTYMRAYEKDNDTKWHNILAKDNEYVST